MRFVAVLMLALLVAGPGQVADKYGNWNARGPGADSCGTFLQDEKKSSAVRFTYDIWILGFISAYNSSMDDTWDLLGNTDPAEAYVWLKNFCLEHPLELLSTATLKLIIELHPQRTWTAPK